MKVKPNAETWSKMEAFWGTRDFISNRQLTEFLPFDGNTTNRRWNNFIPLGVEGLTSSMLASEVPQELFEANPSIRFDRLQEKADFLSDFGEMNRAFGCLLAGQMIHSKASFKSRNTKHEYALLTRALYHLRRGVPKNSPLSAECLSISLFQLQRLMMISRPDLKQKVYLLLELGSWLNEQGHPELSSPILNEVRIHLKGGRIAFSPSEYSGFARQMSQLCLALGRRSEAMNWITVALQCGDTSLQNTAGAATALIQLKC